jgi:hypothetical protein
MSGVHTGPLPDLPPTGKTFQMTMITVFWIADGKIVEE